MKWLARKWKQFWCRWWRGHAFFYRREVTVNEMYTVTCVYCRKQWVYLPNGLEVTGYEPMSLPLDCAQFRRDHERLIGRSIADDGQ